MAQEAIPKNEEQVNPLGCHVARSTVCTSVHCHRDTDRCAPHAVLTLWRSAVDRFEQVAWQRLALVMTTMIAALALAAIETTMIAQCAMMTMTVMIMMPVH